MALSDFSPSLALSHVINPYFTLLVSLLTTVIYFNLLRPSVPPPQGKKLAREDEDEGEVSEEDEGGETKRNTNPRRMKLCRELSSLISLHRTRFTDLNTARTKRKWEKEEIGMRFLFLFFRLLFLVLLLFCSHPFTTPDLQIRCREFGEQGMEALRGITDRCQGHQILIVTDAKHLKINS